MDIITEVKEGSELLAQRAKLIIYNKTDIGGFGKILKLRFFGDDVHQGEQIRIVGVDESGECTSEGIGNGGNTKTFSCEVFLYDPANEKTHLLGVFSKNVHSPIGHAEKRRCYILKNVQPMGVWSYVSDESFPDQNPSGLLNNSGIQLYEWEKWPRSIVST